MSAKALKILKDLAECSWLDEDPCDIEDLAKAKKEARELLEGLEPDPDEALYLAYAQENLQADGDLEFDDDAVVSMGDDKGAYVQAWKWVYASDVPGVGQEHDEEEDGDEPDAADPH